MAALVQGGRRRGRVQGHDVDDERCLIHHPTGGRARARATPKTQTNQRTFENRKEEARARAAGRVAKYRRPSGSIVTGAPAGRNLAGRCILEEGYR